MSTQSVVYQNIPTRVPSTLTGDEDDGGARLNLLVDSCQMHGHVPQRIFLKLHPLSFHSFSCYLDEGE